MPLFPLLGPGGAEGGKGLGCFCGMRLLLSVL